MPAPSLFSHQIYFLTALPVNGKTMHGECLGNALSGKRFSHSEPRSHTHSDMRQQVERGVSEKDGERKKRGTWQLWRDMLLISRFRGQRLGWLCDVTTKGRVPDAARRATEGDT